MLTTHIGKFSLFVKNDILPLNASLAMAIIIYISLGQRVSLVKTLPRYRT